MPDVSPAVSGIFINNKLSITIIFIQEIHIAVIVHVHMVFLFIIIVWETGIRVETGSIACECLERICKVETAFVDKHIALVAVQHEVGQSVHVHVSHYTARGRLQVGIVGASHFREVALAVILQHSHYLHVVPVTAAHDVERAVHVYVVCQPLMPLVAGPVGERHGIDLRLLLHSRAAAFGIGHGQAHRLRPGQVVNHFPFRIGTCHDFCFLSEVPRIFISVPVGQTETYGQRIDCVQSHRRKVEVGTQHIVFKHGLLAPFATQSRRVYRLYGNVIFAHIPRLGVYDFIKVVCRIALARTQTLARSRGIGKPHIAGSRLGAYAQRVSEVHSRSTVIRTRLPLHAQCI